MRCKNLVSFGASMMITLTALVAGAKPLPVTVDPAAQAASARALKDLGGQRLAGMPAAHQMDKTALGEPFVVKMVQLDDLQRWQPAAGMDAAALVRDAQTLIYPVRVAGRINGEMVMRKVDGVWSPRGFAGPRHVQAMDSVRGLVTRAAALPAGSTMLVQVPALNIEFVAYTDEGGPQLTPLTSLPAAGLEAGRTLPAARVFDLLAPLAAQHDGQPT